MKYIIMFMLLCLSSDACAIEQCVVLDQSGWSEDKKKLVQGISYKLISDSGEDVIPTVNNNQVCADITGVLSLIVNNVTYDLEYLEVYKGYKIGDITAKTQDLIKNGVSHDSKVFALDVMSNDKMVGYYNKKETFAYPFKVITKNGDQYTINSANDMDALYSEGVNTIKGHYDAELPLIDSVNGCLTIQCVDSVQDKR